MSKSSLYLLILVIVLASCDQTERNQHAIINSSPEGTLYIIGGGKRTPEMIRQMISLSGVDTAGYIMIIPQASEEPYSAAFYARKQFEHEGAYEYKVLSIENHSHDDTGDLVTL